MTDPEDVDRLVCNGHNPDNGDEEAHEASGRASRCMVAFSSETYDEDSNGHTSQGCCQQDPL